MKRILSITLVFMLLLPFMVPLRSYAATITPEEQEANKEVVRVFFRDVMQVNEAVICGVLANIQKESSFNPTATYTEADGSVSFGICQWNRGRRQNLEAFCAENGYDVNSLTGQLWFLKHELEGSEKGAWSAVKTVPNDARGAYDAGYSWACYFERCHNSYYTQRAELAINKYWPVYGTNSTYTSYTIVPDGLYYIQNVYTADYLTVDGADAKSTNISTTAYNGTSSQVFAITCELLGFEIRPMNYSSVANVYANYVSSGKNVCLWDKTGSTSQLWYFYDTGNGYNIHSVMNQSCVMDTNWVNALVSTAHGGQAQCWYLIPYCYHSNTRIDNAKSATCTSDGYSGDTYCLDCGYTIMRGKTVSATGHSYTESTVIPTPSGDGYTKHYCTLCGDTYNDGYTAYNPEKYPAVTASSAYGTKGETVQIALSSSNFPTVGTVTISDLEYNSKMLTFEGFSTTKDGQKTAEFSRECSKSQGEFVYLNFKINDRVTYARYPVKYKVQITYPVAGENDKALKLDTPNTAVEIGPCIHRNGTRYVEGYDATCYSDGIVSHYRCDICNGFFLDEAGSRKVPETATVIISDGHVFNSYYTLDVAPTETEKGSCSVHCANCEVTKNSKELPPTSSIKAGDYDGNGTVNITDVLYVRKYVTGKAYSVSWIYTAAADSDGDGRTTAADILRTRQIVMGME